MERMSSLSNRNAELPPPALVSEGSYKPLTYIDAIFGGYCVALTLVALVAWLQNMGNVWSGVILAAFAAVNAVISLLSLRSAKPLRVEVSRAIVGAVIAPAAYLLMGAPFSRWWPGFLIMCLGGNVMVGLLTGPVVAGVIGKKKFIYDLWGDTVNVASRMEAQGIVGSIQVTAETHKRLRDQFTFEERGTMPVRGSAG